jgi:Fur family zinc uptake transcriptional regulator
MSPATGAYDLKASFERKYGRSVRPNTIYRTLDFFEEQGLVVHLASTRAYAARVIRESNDFALTSLFLVCQKCGQTIECHDSRIGSAIRRSADAIGFVTRMRAVDLEGICRECSSKLAGKTKLLVS